MREPHKILIIRFSSLGDIILASPLIRVLRARFPAAQIDFLLKSEYADLIRYNPHLSSILELTTSERSDLNILSKQLRTEHYDLLIDIHNSLRSRYLRWQAGVKDIRIVDKREVKRFLLVHFKWNLYNGNISVADRYLETLEPWGIHNDDKGLEVFIPETTVSAMKSMLSRYKLEQADTVIGLAPSARHFTKRWLPDRFVEFGALLAKQRRIKILIFGNRDEIDYCGDIAQMINARLGSPVAESLAGKISLLETAAVLDHCHAVASNDSGMMHLAAARKRKVIAIFGSTVREFGFFPYGTDHVVVETKGLDCRPCTTIGLSKCPKGHFRCMKDITTNDVLEATQQILSGH